MLARRVSRRLAILAIAAPLAACGSSSASSTGMTSAVRPAACGPRSARTLASSGRARVYAVNEMVYGCAVGRHKVFRLGALRPCLSAPCVGRVRVAGTYAAYTSVHHGVDTAVSEVIVRRLTDGKTLTHDTATIKPLGPESFQTVASLVLKKDGAVAWIGSAASIVKRSSKDIEVLRHDRAGRKLLDSSPAINPASLRLAGSRLRWIAGGVRRSARLS